MDKIVIYTTGNGQLTKEREDLAGEAALIAQCSGKSLEDTFRILAGFMDEGKRIIHHYPALGDFDTSPYDFLCEIPDGAVYVG